MSELIDRETTVKQICKIGEMLGVGHDRDVTIAVALFVQDDKSAFPTVEERPHGEWIRYTEDGFDYAKCSACKWDSGEAFEYAIDRFPFCPNCGSDNRKKEGEKNENT